jgi:hypothetical protein
MDAREEGELACRNTTNKKRTTTMMMVMAVMYMCE